MKTPPPTPTPISLPFRVSREWTRDGEGLAGGGCEFYLPPPLTTVFQFGVDDVAETCHICWLQGLPSLLKQLQNQIPKIFEISPKYPSSKEAEAGRVSKN